MTRDVRWHEIGRKLYPRHVQGHCLCQSADQQCLAQTRYALDQHMPRNAEGDDGLVDDRSLTDERFADAVAQLGQQFAGPQDRIRFIVHNRAPWV